MLSSACRKPLGLLLCLTAGACAAQEDTTQPIGAADLVACLTPAVAQRGEPAYPSDLQALGVDRSVEVELTFSNKDASPNVRFLTENKFDDQWTSALFKSVGRFVSQYRLPCMEDGAVKLTQVFNFRSDRRPVYWSQLTQGELEYARAGCSLDYVGKPYQIAWGKYWRYGNLVYELTFTQPEAVPQVRVIYTPEQDLVPHVMERIQGYRLKCRNPPETPVRVHKVLSFRSEANKGATLKNMDFVTFVKSVEREAMGNAVFDFHTMSCPFAVRVQLLAPYARNRVGELEQTDPNRTTFLKWLSGLTYRYPRNYETFLIGGVTTVTVPCMKLDLS